MGGILIFTVEFNEPFFTTRLHAIECNRLQTITSRASINRVIFYKLQKKNPNCIFSVYFVFFG